MTIGLHYKFLSTLITGKNKGLTNERKKKCLKALAWLEVVNV